MPQKIEETIRAFKSEKDGCKPSVLSSLLSRFKGGLEYLKTFQCEHGQPDCFHVDPPRGGCCNSCWVRSWAEQILAEIEAG